MVGLMQRLPDWQRQQRRRTPGQTPPPPPPWLLGWAQVARVGWAVAVSASSVLFWVADNCTGGPRFDALLDAAATMVRGAQQQPSEVNRSQQ